VSNHTPGEHHVVTVWVRTDRAGSKYELEIRVDADEWAEFEAKEKDAHVWEEITNRSLIEWGWRE
jgi:hypothetical protein